jgi:hypothetical protein
MIFTISLEDLNQGIEYADGDCLLAFLGDSINRREQLNILTTWTSKDPGASIIYLLTEQDSESIKRMYDIFGVPVYLLFRNDKLMKTHVGDVDENRLDNWFTNDVIISSKSVVRAEGGPIGIYPTG